jgi:acyl carrier protein
MSDIELRLVKCFRAVFGLQDEARIRSATQDTVSEWDSVSAVMLLHVVEEEFGFPIELDDFQEFSSFARIREYLLRQPSLRERDGWTIAERGLK